MYCEKMDQGTIRSTFDLKPRGVRATAVQRGLLCGEDVDARNLAGYNPGTWDGEIIREYVAKLGLASVAELDDDKYSAERRELRRLAFTPGDGDAGRAFFDLKLNRIAFSLGGKVPGSRNGGTLGLGEGLTIFPALKDVDPLTTFDPVTGQSQDVTPELLERTLTQGQLDRLYANVQVLTELAEIDEKK